MLWIFVITFIVVFFAGSVWAYYKYLRELTMTGKPYKIGGNTLTFVFTLPLSFIVAEVIKDKLLMAVMPDGFGLQTIFILLIVLANYLICILSTAVAKKIIKNKNTL